MPEGDILHDTAGDCSDKELLTARLPALEFTGVEYKTQDNSLESNIKLKIIIKQ